MAKKVNSPKRLSGRKAPGPQGGNDEFMSQAAKVLAPFLGQDGLVIILSLASAHWAVSSGINPLFAYGIAAYGIAVYSCLTWLRLRR
jgi:hypothetical protein